MRKSIIRMNLSYSDIEKLKKKIENFINLERKYARLFHSEDEEKQELRKYISALQQELKNEREEKLCIISENEEKIQQLTESLNNIKNQMKHLHMEKAKRHYHLKALEQRINKRVDAHSYYHS
jgi:chromosome segregation ATPase